MVEGAVGVQTLIRGNLRMSTQVVRLFISIDS